MWLKLKTFVTKGEIVTMSNVSFGHSVFENRLLKSCQKASVCGKGKGKGKRKGKVHLSTVKTRTSAFIVPLHVL